jgi:hypothetical protein
MSEIRVEEKKHGSIWPWIIGILALLAVVWAVVEIADDDDDDAVVAEAYTDDTYTDDTYTEPERETVTNTNYSDVNAFVTFANDEGNMGLDHNYTSEGLMKLNAALEAMAAEASTNNVDVSGKLNMMRQAANSIEKDPMATTHANSIRDAFMASANLMEAIQQSDFPNLGKQVQEVKQAAMEVKPDELTLNQKEAVKSYFDKAAMALDQMAN